MVRRTIRPAAAVVLVWLWALPCGAEPTEQAVKIARKRFLEGVAAVDAGKYEAARLAFQQAYALRPHAGILRNLGQAEFQVSRYLEAARHLSTFLRDTTFGTAEERAAAQKTLAQAEARVGRLVAEVEPDGADVSVDGELVGRSPLGPDPYYVELGPRIVRIRRDGYSPYEGVHTFEAGRTINLRIDLKPATAEGKPATIPGSEPAAALPALASDSDAGRAAALAPPASTSESASPNRGAAPSGDHGLMIALATTGGLTVVSAGVWIGFALEGASLQRQQDRLLEQISKGCPGDVRCGELSDVSQRRANANQVATIGAVVAGVSAAAFVVTWLIWPKSGSGSGATSRVVPGFSPGWAGVDLVGAFE